MSSTIFGTYYFNKLFLVYLKLKHKRVSYFDLETLWCLPTAPRSHTGRGTSVPLPEASGVNSEAPLPGGGRWKGEGRPEHGSGIPSSWPRCQGGTGHPHWAKGRWPVS